MDKIVNTPDKPPLRVLSLGAGAIGTYIGGSLALNGNYVVFLEQESVAQELRKRPLRLKLDGTEYEVKQPPVVGSLEEALKLGPYDVALFALKSYDTVSALEGMAEHAAELPPFLCLSNGVDNEAAIAAALGADKVIAGTVTSAVGRRAAGDIALERLRGVGIAGEHPSVNKLVEAMNAAGLNAVHYANAASMKWSKMLTNLLTNATSAILDMTPAEVLADSKLYGLEMRQLREALAVMKAQGLKVVDLPGTPVRALALAARLPTWMSRPLLRRGVAGGRGAKMPSFHIDLHGGRGKSEVNYLNGAVVRAGEKLGIPTPANRLLNETLMKLTKGELKIEDYRRNPERLLANLT